MTRDNNFFVQLESANAYFERLHYTKDLEKLFSSRRFYSRLQGIYEDRALKSSWDEFRIDVILETKIVVFCSMDKASRVAGNKVDLSKCEKEILAKAEVVARRVSNSSK